MYECAADHQPHISECKQTEHVLGTQKLLFVHAARNLRDCYILYKEDEPISERLLELCKDYPTFAYAGWIYGIGRSAGRMCWWKDIA